MDGIDFNELNKIGEDWEHKVVVSSAEELEAPEDVNAPEDAPQDANGVATGEA